MTKVEHIHTLLDEDKDALVSSYLSLLASIRTHQGIYANGKDLLDDIKQIVNNHLDKLPVDSKPIYEELVNNEVKRLEDQHNNS